MDKIGRNQPCPCGSRIKYKKCCLNNDAKRKRSEWTYATTECEVSEIGLAYNSASDEIEFEQPMINKFHEVSYHRDSGKKKIISRTPIATETAQLNSDQALLRNSDLLFAVDTNTRTINSLRHSVGCFVLCEIFRESQSKGTFKWSIPFCIHFTGHGEPERFSWKVLSDHIESDDELRQIPRIVIVVDSDLDNIPSYNDGSMPILRTFYLPKNIQLTYASSDSGNKYIANKLISAADKTAKRILGEIEAGRIEGFPKRTEPGSYIKLRSRLNHEEPKFKSLRRHL